MSKNYFILLLTIVSFKQIKAQAPNWAWANGANQYCSNMYGGGNSGNAIVSDAYGNTYSIGSFSSEQFIIGSYTLTNAATTEKTDVFIVKYDANGNVIWLKGGIGTGSDNGLGIALDASSNVYITGSFTSPSITFDTETLTNTSSGTDDMFLVKYNSSGNIIWAKSFGGSNDDFGNAIAVDGMNNVCIAGSFKSPIFSIGTYTLTYDSTLYSDMFMAKYDVSGNVLFAQSIGKSCSISMTGSNIACDANDGIYITGTFTDSNVVIGNDTLINKGTQNVFIAKYNSSGSPLWAKCAGGSYVDKANGIAIKDNNLYIAGIFASPSFIIGMDTLALATPYPYCKTFIAKYNLQGDFVWAKNTNAFNPNSIIHGPCIAINEIGGVYVAGGFVNQSSNTPSLIFGSDTLNSINPSQDDIFIAKYDSLGNSLWGKTSQGACYSWDQLLAITSDSYGNIYSIGFTFSDSLIFGNDTLLNVNGYTQAGRINDYFAAKLGDIGVGIEQYKNQNSQFKIYPNPANTILNIIVGSGEVENIKVFDVLGNAVNIPLPPFKGGQAILDVSTLQSGVYFVRVGTSTQKFIKQ